MSFVPLSLLLSMTTQKVASATATTKTRNTTMEEELDNTKNVQDNAAEARAAAMAVLKRADERDQQLHPPPAKTKAALFTNTASSSSSRSNNNKITAEEPSSPSSSSPSPTLIQSFKEHIQEDMKAIKSRISELDDKLLEKQMESEERIRHQINKTKADLSEMLSPKKDKKTTPRKSSAFKEMVIEDINAAKDEVQAALNKAKSKIQSITLPSNSSKKNTKINADEKILNDLQLVHEQMTLCHSLTKDRDRDDPVLLKVIGFLEACLERMEHVTAAGSNGYLQDETTQICLSTYRRLILTLEQCDSPFVASNAFSFARSLEGDAEFDEPSPESLEGDDEFDEPPSGVALTEFLEGDDEFDEPSNDDNELEAPTFEIGDIELDDDENAPAIIKT